MRHRAGHTVHDKRREPIDPRFRHGAEGVADKRVVECAESTHVRARDRNHGGAPRGQSLRGNEPRSTVQTYRTRRHPVPRGSPPKAVEKMGVGEGRSRLKWRG